MLDEYLGDRPHAFMRVEEALSDAERRLRSLHVGSPELTARVLLAHALGRDQAWLVAHSADLLEDGVRTEYGSLIQARCDGVPTQYLRGTQEFYGLEMQVTPDVLIPRPETEHLVEAAIERLRPGDRAVDIGTGCGAVAIALAAHAPTAVVHASDVSGKALAVARANAARLNVQVRTCLGDLTEPFAPSCFDVVVSNPPYVPRRNAGGLQRELRHEPSIALYGGEDGMRVIERLLAGAPRVLKPGGWLLVEIGFDCRTATERLLAGADWEAPAFLPDLAGIDRVVAVRRAANA